MNYNDFISELMDSGVSLDEIANSFTTALNRAAKLQKENEVQEKRVDNLIKIFNNLADGFAELFPDLVSPKELADLKNSVTRQEMRELLQHMEREAKRIKNDPIAAFLAEYKLR